MREERAGKHGHREHGEHRGRGQHGMKDSIDQYPRSAQTFRRGRAIAFLDKLNVNRSTLQRQLKDPEFDSIKQVISGELKATEAIIEEFIHMFQIHEIASEDINISDNKKEERNENNENN
ncbi:hypothetical protein [Paenibacillus pini]|uniref:Uncharacterized protein n=1 Tax=Paenibacillus pini JCM 16418 TaxID=1236976 RepID=W7Z4U9_9BACL|nr:hypothetical protein [Paenibacillus pini]GAF09369.1 hypothetical protein JCM16418_3508 [Paenibacillus pini JCM 16418]